MNLEKRVRILEQHFFGDDERDTMTWEEFQYVSRVLDARWRKRDCIEEDIPDVPRRWNHDQLMATWDRYVKRRVAEREAERMRAVQAGNQPAAQALPPPPAPRLS